MKKTLIIAAVTFVTLTATLSFKYKTQVTPVKQETASVNKGTGFALQDSDQWN